MKILKVGISVGATNNIGNYENVRADVAYEAQVIEGEDEHDVIDQVREMVKTELKNTLDILESERGK